MNELAILSRPIILSGSKISAGAGEQTITLTTGVGAHRLIPVVACGWQESGGVRWEYWSHWDGAALLRFQAEQVASGVRFFLGRNGRLTFPVIYNESRYLRYRWTATGAGETGYALGVFLIVDNNER